MAPSLARIWRGSDRRATSKADSRWRLLSAKLIEDWWLLEVLSILSSCLAVVALGIVLRVYDGQPIPSFGTLFNSGITLSTIVAALTTVSVATALSVVEECLSQLKWLWYRHESRPLRDIDSYDQASRGPFGSFRLLCVLRIIRSPSASFGAILMIAQLFITPLAQQSIVYVTQNVPDTAEPATVPTTTGWEDTSNDAITPNMPAHYTQLSSGMKGAIFGGLFTGANTIINATAPSCPSGNCTFTTYYTLAVCASSTNVSAHLEAVGTPADLQRLCLPGGQCLNNWNSTYSPIANVTSAAPFSTPDASDNSDPAEGSWDDFVTEPLNFTSLGFADHKAPLADTYLIYSSAESGRLITALEFILDWCVVGLSTTVVNGIATTTRHSAEWLNLTAVPGPVALTSMTTEVNGLQFTIQSHTHNTLQRYFQYLFNGTIVFNGFSYADTDEVQALCEPLGVHSLDSNTPGVEEPLIFRGLSVFDNLLANIAQSMTNWIQGANLGFFWATQTTGVTYRQQNVVSIHWGWVSAPIAFTVASLALFASLLALGSRRRTPSERPTMLWKSSTIASLRALDATRQQALGGMKASSEMIQSSKEIYVRLERVGSGWRLADTTREQKTTVEKRPTPDNSDRAFLVPTASDMMTASTPAATPTDMSTVTPPVPAATATADAPAQQAAAPPADASTKAPTQPTNTTAERPPDPQAGPSAATETTATMRDSRESQAEPSAAATRTTTMGDSRESQASPSAVATTTPTMGDSRESQARPSAVAATIPTTMRDSRESQADPSAAATKTPTMGDSRESQASPSTVATTSPAMRDARESRARPSAAATTPTMGDTRESLADPSAAATTTPTTRDTRDSQANPSAPATRTPTTRDIRDSQADPSAPATTTPVIRDTRDSQADPSATTTTTLTMGDTRESQADPSAPATRTATMGNTKEL